MVSKRTYIILISIIIVFGIVMFIIFGIPNIIQDKYEATLIIEDNTTWVYRKKKWLFMRTNNLMEQYNWSVFHVLENNKDIGTYYLWHDDRWYVFDKNKSAVNIDGKMVAYNSNYEMKVKDFEEVKIDDYTYVYKVLEDNNISSNSSFTSAYKVVLDYDGDSYDEEFYIVSNVFALDFNPDVIFSIAFMVKNGETYVFYNDIRENDGVNGCKPYYHTFIDTDNDGIYEIVLSCGQYSVMNRIDMLYQFDEDNFKLLISNQ